MMWSIWLRVLGLTVLVLPYVAAADEQTDRGQYLASIVGCSDCHTRGGLVGHADTKRYFAGSDVGFAIPGQGIYFAPNITPDDETGIGKWTTDQIVAAITTGKRPDGRVLASCMPWSSLSHLTRSDALAIAAYLKSVIAIRNSVAGPMNVTSKPSMDVITIVPGEVYSKCTNAPK